MSNGDERESELRPDIEPTIDYGREYAEAHAAGAYEAFLRFGLATEFGSVLVDHLSDLHIVAKKTREEKSRLSVQVIPGQEEAGEQRLLILDETDIARRVKRLSNALGEIIREDIKAEPRSVAASVLDFSHKTEAGVDEDDTEEDQVPNYSFHVPSNAQQPIHSETDEQVDSPKHLVNAVLDWVFAEQAMVALGNSYYMRNKFGIYVSDFDGQREGVNAELSLSAAYLAGPTHAKLVKRNVAEDFENTKTGFGLIVLQDSLIAHGTVQTYRQARRVVASLKLAHCSSAQNSQEIADRIQSLTPVEYVRSGYRELADVVYDPTITFDDELEP